MNETHGFSKQYDVGRCINEIISLHFGVLLGYITWLFCGQMLLIKSLKVSDQ